MIFKFICFVCVRILPPWASVHMCAWYTHRSEEGSGYPSPGVTDGFESPRGCWKPNLDPLQQLQVLLASEPSVQPLRFNKFLMNEKDEQIDEWMNKL